MEFSLANFYGIDVLFKYHEIVKITNVTTKTKTVPSKDTLSEILLRDITKKKIWIHKQSILSAIGLPMPKQLADKQCGPR